jgi:hypothetical protein
MSIDEDREHASGAVRFDEAHTSHVRSEVVDGLGTATDLTAGVCTSQVEFEVLRRLMKLMPLLDRFAVDRSNALALLHK